MASTVCETCGETATCYGRYGQEDLASYSCDECCDHCQEDGNCTSIVKRNDAPLPGGTS